MQLLRPVAEAIKALTFTQPMKGLRFVQTKRCHPDYSSL
jgi:hypothetical protein